MCGGGSPKTILLLLLLFVRRTQQERSACVYVYIYACVCIHAIFDAAVHHRKERDAETDSSAKISPRLFFPSLLRAPSTSLSTSPSPINTTPAISGNLAYSRTRTRGYTVMSLMRLIRLLEHGDDARGRRERERRSVGNSLALSLAPAHLFHDSKRVLLQRMYICRGSGVVWMTSGRLGQGGCD